MVAQWCCPAYRVLMAAPSFRGLASISLSWKPDRSKVVRFGQRASTAKYVRPSPEQPQSQRRNATCCHYCCVCVLAASSGSVAYVKRSSPPLPVALMSKESNGSATAFSLFISKRGSDALQCLMRCYPMQNMSEHLLSVVFVVLLSCLKCCHFVKSHFLLVETSGE